MKFKVYAKVPDDDGNQGFLETRSPVATGIDFFFDGGWRGIGYFLLHPESFIVFRSTGIKDSNNEELYEGDEIEGYKKGSKHFLVKGIICWNYKRAGFEIDGVSSRTFNSAVFPSLHGIKKIRHMLDP